MQGLKKETLRADQSHREFSIVKERKVTELLSPGRSGNTGHSSRALEFQGAQLHGRLQPPSALFLWHLLPSSLLSFLINERTTRSFCVNLSSDKQIHRELYFRALGLHDEEKHPFFKVGLLTSEARN